MRSQTSSSADKHCTCRPDGAFNGANRQQYHHDPVTDGGAIVTNGFLEPEIDYHQLEYKIPRIKLEASRENKGDKDKDDSEIWIKDNRSRKEELICRKCQHPVYPTEIIELNRDAIYHPSCFRCGRCGVKLNLGNFCSDLRHGEDVYCRSHRPVPAGHIDSTSMHIDVAKRTPKLDTVNAQIRGPAAGTGAKYDANALCIQSALKSPKVWERPSSCFHTTNVANDIVKGDIIGLKYM